MGCRMIQGELVAFHFGEVDEAVRSEVEAHLLGCSSCLRDYLALKRDLESPGPDVPSARARTRLCTAVAEELGLETRWSWWERPLALASAGASLWAAMFVVHFVSTSPAAPPHAEVPARDAARGP